MSEKKQALNSNKKINNLEDLISEIKKQKNFRSMIKFSNQNYQVKAYKIDKLRPSELKETLNQINMAYQIMDKDQLDKKGNGKKKYMWVVNQLKLFVWLLMAYSFINGISITDYTQQDWKFFDVIFIQKSVDYLQFQSKLFLKNYKGNSQKWEQEEETLLKQIINDQQNKGKWNEISKFLYFNSNKKYYRQPQKCREHWFNHLDPDVKRQNWTYQEDLHLVDILKQCGFKWSLVTKHFKGTRTQHMVKNRAKYLFKKYGGEQQSQDESSKRVLKKIQKRIKHAIQTKDNPPQIQQEQQNDCNEEKEMIQINNIQQKKEKKSSNSNNKKKQVQKKQKNNHEVKIQQQIQFEKKNQKQGFFQEQNQRYNQKIPRNPFNNNFFQTRIFPNINSSPISIPVQKHNLIKNQVYFITAPIHQNIPFHPSFGFSPYQLQFQNNHNPMSKKSFQTEMLFKPKQMSQKTQKVALLQNELPNQMDLVKYQYGIIQEYESEEQQMNLNLEEIKFNHERDGGKMRERITHELQALFNSMNQQQPKQDFNEY